jgi:hypothetical protein
MRYRPFGTIHPSPGEFGAERSEIYIPDQVVTPPAERHKKRKKGYKGHVSPLAQQDSDPMEVEAPRARSELQTVSPESIRPSQHSPSKQAVTGKGSERQEEKKKKKKHKDREASSTWNHFMVMLCGGRTLKPSQYENPCINAKATSHRNAKSLPSVQIYLLLNPSVGSGYHKATLLT